jgi:hypothetical protein
MHSHHLNCATMRPGGRRLVNGTGGLFEAGRMVCHCLLIETDHGLVLVGTADIRDPVASLGARFLRTTRPRLDANETARHRAALAETPVDLQAASCDPGSSIG